MHLFQWVEESYTNFEKGINWRSYVVCDVAYNNVNNWLWTPFIERGIANRIYIEIKFTIRDCSLFPGNALSCKETFSLLYYEFDAATREPPPWEPESYKLIGKRSNFIFHYKYYTYIQTQSKQRTFICFDISIIKLNNLFICLNISITKQFISGITSFFYKKLFKRNFGLISYSDWFKCFVVK